MVTTERADGQTPWWRTPQVLAAVVAGVAAITVAVINLAGNGNGDGGGGDDGSDGTTAPVVRLVGTGNQPAAPPPAVTYWFEGRVDGMTPSMRVFVLRVTDTTGGAPAEPSTVSPPASYLPGGRWRVEWTFPAPPESLQFAAVLAELPTTLDGGSPGDVPGATGPSGEPGPSSTSVRTPAPDDAVSRALRDRLLRAGAAGYEVVRDEVTLRRP